jgi:hypothetical protein
LSPNQANARAVTGIVFTSAPAKALVERQAGAWTSSRRSSDQVWWTRCTSSRLEAKPTSRVVRGTDLSTLDASGIAANAVYDARPN